MLSVSICWDSGGWVAIWKSGPLPSPGRRTAERSDRSAAVGPPSTASGPRMPLSRWARFPKLLRFSWPGWRVNHGSATSGTVTGVYQSVVLKVTTAAHWVTVTVLGTPPAAGFAFAVSVRTSSLDEV